MNRELGTQGKHRRDSEVGRDTGTYLEGIDQPRGGEIGTWQVAGFRQQQSVQSEGAV